MTNDKIQKLREAAEAIAEIVKQHKAEGEAIRKALEPLRDVVEPVIVDRVVVREAPPWVPGVSPIPVVGTGTGDPIPNLTTYCHSGLHVV